MDLKDASVSEESAFLNRPFDTFEGLIEAARSLCIDNVPLIGFSLKWRRYP